MTSNFQLEGYVRRYPLPKGSTFLGVFPSNTLPRSNIETGCLIANYSPYGASGTHWVAMRELNGKVSEYFDSYGLAPDAADSILKLQTNFTGYLKEHSKTKQFVYNQTDLQSWVPTEDECGEWAIAFLYHGLPKMSEPFWVPYLKEPDGLKRDRMIRARIGIVKLRNKLNEKEIL